MNKIINILFSLVFTLWVTSAIKMKIKLLTIAAFMLYATAAGAVDLSTTFGSPKPTPVAVTKAMFCTVTKPTLIANGVDSAVVSAKDLTGAAVSGVDVSVSGSASKSFTNIALPQTVTASGAGEWDFILTKAGYNSNCSFSIVAQ